MLSHKYKSRLNALLTQKWAPYLGLLLITLLGAAFRLFRLGEWSFWIDEIYTLNHDIQHFSTPKLILENIPPLRNWIPISVIMTAQVLNFGGVNELNARLAAAIIGIITIPILYFPVKNIFNTRVALITALLLAVSPWHLEWSQNARGYTSLMLFYWLALFALYFGLEKDRIVYFVLFFLFLYLSSSERLIALFIVPVIFVYLLILGFLNFEKPIGLRMRNVLILLSPVILFGLLTIFSSIQSGESIFGSILSEILNTFFGKPIESSFTQTIFIIFEIGIPVFILSLASGFYIWGQRDRHKLLFFVAAVIPLGLVAILSPFMFTEERYVFPTLPAWLVLAAIAVDVLWGKLGKRETIFTAGILTLLIVVAMGANLMYYHVNHGNRRDYKGAFAIVQKNIQEDDVVVSTGPKLGDYYLNQEVLLWESLDVNTIKASEDRIWFVVVPDMAWFTGTEDLYWWVSHNTRLVKTLYLRTIDNANIEIYLFDPAVTTDSLKYE